MHKLKIAYSLYFCGPSDGKIINNKNGAFLTKKKTA